MKVENRSGNKERAFERQKRVPLRRSKDGLSLVTSICGPSGAGKTTLVKALADDYPSYLETTKGNPYLEALLKGRSDFDAESNQKWFLERIGKHIGRADPELPLILDQDPVAIVRGYAKIFLEDGKMQDGQFAQLRKRLSEVERALRSWRCPRLVVFLDAPSDVLYHRVLKRSGKSQTPPPLWFERVRNQFVALFPTFPNALKISTERLSAEQITKYVRDLIERRVRDCQA